MLCQKFFSSPFSALKERQIVSTESKISLNCPGCEQLIYEPLEWFKQPFSACPVCDTRWSAEQFSSLIADLEQAMDRDIDEMVGGSPHKSCCGKGSSCCS
jgi:hypothetical protein